MRNFTKIANLHRVFFKQAQEAGPLPQGAPLGAWRGPVSQEAPRGAPRPPGPLPQGAPIGARRPPSGEPSPINNRPALTNSGSNSMLYTPGMEQFPAPADYGQPRAQHSSGFKLNNKPSWMAFPEADQFITHKGQGLTPKPGGPRPPVAMPLYDPDDPNSMKKIMASDPAKTEESRYLHEGMRNAIATPYGKLRQDGIVEVDQPNPTERPHRTANFQ